MDSKGYQEEDGDDIAWAVLFTIPFAHNVVDMPVTMMMIASMVTMTMNKDVVRGIFTLGVVIGFFLGLTVGITINEAFAEITNIQPIDDQYTFGQTVSIIAHSDQDIVHLRFVDEQDNTVELLQIIANGQFIGSAMIAPSTWSPGQYVVVMDDGHQKKAMEFQVVGNIDLEPITQETGPEMEQLVQENRRLKVQIVELEDKIANLEAIIHEQIKIIYDWILAR